MSKTHSVLALHGFTGCGEDFSGFSPFCHALASWDCPTLPGHGPDPQLDCSHTSTVEFIQQQLPTPQSKQTTANILLGYSMGARALLQYACAYPNSCDAFILIGCNPGIEDDSERSDRCAADTLLAQDIETYGVARFLSNWEETPLIRAQQGMRSEWRAQMRANRLEHQAEGLAASLRQFGQGSCPNLWPQLSKLAMPILLITGSEDTKYTDIAKRMQSELPNAAHQVINGASHAPHFEAPETTAQVIDAFISG